ncbi:uncharacterized protein LOC143210906 [Lasioglossum baleicum]|uniref:uncharacterized protein LOC143210906 n=1 Tax=Lasioglossum baleicum TaxID=434251 RepID=UPI003FCDD555
MVAGYVSLLYSISDKPLEYWRKHQSQSGRIRKILDSDLLENVIEVQDLEQTNDYGTSILCPPDSSQFLNIELPVLVVVIKNLNLHCRLQVQVVDTQNCLHHFQFTNAESERYNSRGVICRVRVKLETGWNKLELNLSQLTQTAFNSIYAATQRLQIYGNCRLRRVYFIDKHYEHQEVCPELYHHFLDTYMLKWGIHGVEKSTQTNTKRTKSRIREGNNQKHSAKLLNSDNASFEGSNDTKGTKRKLVDQNFLRCLQIKNDILINDFFERQSGKLPRATEFKQHAKLKRYVFPAMDTSPKYYDPNLIADDTFKKINILKTLTNTFIPNEETQKKEEATKSMQEKWQHRYCLHHEETKSSDSVKQNLRRTMLDRRPKSTSILSETKDCGANKKIAETMKACYTIKHDDQKIVVK